MSFAVMSFAVTSFAVVKALPSFLVGGVAPKVTGW